MQLMRDKLVMRADALIGMNGGTMKCERFQPVQDFIYRCNGGDPESRRGRKEAREITLMDALSLTDDCFLDMFMILARQSFKQM